jgi:polysaccharide biosynthesis/export protein
MMNRNNHFKISYATLLLFFLFSGFNTFINTTFAQKVAVPVDAVSDDKLKEYYQKALSSGMSEAQIEQLALSKGYTTADIARVKERLANLQTSGGKGVADDEINLPRKQSGDGLDIKKKAIYDTLNYEPKKELFDIDTRIAKEVFGANLFNNPSMTFEPNLRIATPRSYQLGPEDELIIEVTGNNFDTFKAKVSPEGTIKILGLKPIYVNGRTIDQAEEIIINRIRQLYGSVNQPGSGTYAQITLGNVRSIKVILTGEVARPGTYTVSSLATVFNALYAAGGPSENGSFRNIKVIRDNKTVRTLDLYDFLLRADKKDDIRLQDQDVILIPDYESHVHVSGEVKRPAIYEVQKGENLKTLLRFAGGFTEEAYTFTINLKRNTAKERKIFNITQEEINEFVPQSGDKYMVGKILERFENLVTVEGAVFRKGEYALEKGTSTVKELIQKAEGLKENAFLERATIIRERANLDPEVISFDLGKLMRGEIADLPLKRQDSLKVFTVEELREKRTISIEGAINKGGVFDYKDNMSIADLIIMAKGFAESAFPDKIEVSRRIKEDTTGLKGEQTVRIYSLTVGNNLQIMPEDAKFKLQPFDIVYVRNLLHYEPQKSIYIRGEVNYPGYYALQDKTERVADIIKRAGGFTPSAFLNGARLTRNSTELVAISLQKAIDDNNSTDNVLMIQGDSLFIPRKLETIQLAGEVINPLSVTYKAHFSLKDYISEAGGFTQKAFRREIYVTYVNGSSASTKHFLFFRKYPKIEEGSTITVPVENKEKTKLSTPERIAVFGLLGTLSLSLISIINILKK